MLPALPVERPLAVPRGWSVLSVAASSGSGWATLRYGVLPRVELNIGGGLVTAGGLVPADPELGVRLQILRREPPNTSIAADLRWTAPLVGTAAIAGGLVASRRLGPLLGTVGAGGRWDGALVPTATAKVLLQAGPLGPWGEVSWDGGVDLAWGLVLQLSRGLAVYGVLGEPDAVGVEIAF